MCGGSKPEPKPAPAPKAQPYWDWWNSPQPKEGINGSYRLNRLAIGSALEASKGTSRLKNINTGTTRDTTGRNHLNQDGKELGRPEPKPKPKPKPRNHGLTIGKTSGGWTIGKTSGGWGR